MSRWQVVGAIALGEQPLTVSQVARRMGLTRQSVHATVNRSTADGIVELASNVDHRRSQVVRLTDVGRATYGGIDGKQGAWVNDLAPGMTRAELRTTARVLGEPYTRLEAAPRSERGR